MKTILYSKINQQLVLLRKAPIHFTYNNKSVTLFYLIFVFKYLSKIMKTIKMS